MSIEQEEQRVRELAMRIEIRKWNTILRFTNTKIVDAEEYLKALEIL